MSKEIPGKIGEYDDDVLVEISNSTDSTKHYRVITKEQYLFELREAYFAGWEDRNDCDLLRIFHNRGRTKEEYFEWFWEDFKNKKRIEVIFDDDDGQPD